MPEHVARRPSAARRAVRWLTRREPDAATAGDASGGPEHGPEHGPRLSVIVPVYNVERYLRECLDSVLGQTLEDLEVIAVDDGSSDASPQILAEYAARDPRLRLVHQPNGGLGSARNRGLELARGEFLTFCDSDDTLPPRAYEVMVRTLRRSGSDFVVGAARRVKHGRNRQVAWGETVHAFDRIATTIDEFPAAMQDIIACNRVFRTDFWRERIGVFEEGVAYEDHVPMLAAYVRADHFDVLARVTYHWRMREDLTSIGQQKADLQNLRDRVAVKEQAYELLRAEATPAAYDAWVGRCLDIDFPPFLRQALTASDDYRDLLASTYRTFLDRASEQALRTVRHPRLVRAWLCAGGHWDELAQADAWFAARRPPVVRVEGDRLFAVPDLPASVTDLVPAAAWELAQSETALRTAVRGVRRAGTSIVIDGYALVPGLDSDPAELGAWLVERDGERRVDLPVTPGEEPEIDQWVGDGVGHARAAFVTTLDLGDLARHGAGAWRLRLRLRHGQVVRESGVYDAVGGSGAAEPRREDVELGDGVVRVEPGWDSAGGFQLLLAPAAVVLDELAPPDGGTLRGRVRGPDLADTRVLARADGDRVVTAHVADDGSFSLDLPDPELTWTLRAKAPGQRAQPLLWPGAERQIGAPGSDRVVWQPTADGAVQAVPDGRAVHIERVEVRPDAIITEVSTAGISPSELAGAVWRAKHVELPVGAVEEGTHSTTLTFPTRIRPDHGVAMVAPAAAYLLTVRTTDGLQLTARPSGSFATALPWSRLGTDVRVSLRLRPDRAVVADLAAPLDDEERTPAFRERVLRAQHRRGAAPAPSPAALLHALGPDDGRRALAAALARSHPELDRLWAAPDRSSAVPAGATSLLVGSRRWYDALGDASLLCTSGDLPDHFRSAAGQRTLQIFDGFPVRRVGRSMWRARGLPERAIALEVTRRRQQWDTIVAPTDAIAELYRSEFEFDGPIVVTGHPRCDDLVTRDRASVRADVLARLGVPEEHTVVLHVRAHRDRATRALLRDAPAPELDLARLAHGLGPDHVVLAVGVPDVPHPQSPAARIVDATTYPAVNDLLLAADAAVLDYSDLRFDWALTGRPAIFHVPDHDAYLAAVAAPIDFDESTAGPQVGDTDAVVEAVRDRAVLEREHAAGVAALNGTYNALHDGRAGERAVDALLS